MSVGRRYFPPSRTLVLLYWGNAECWRWHHARDGSQSVTLLQQLHVHAGSAKDQQCGTSELWHETRRICSIKFNYTCQFMCFLIVRGAWLEIRIHLGIYRISVKHTSTSNFIYCPFVLGIHTRAQNIWCKLSNSCCLWGVYLYGQIYAYMYEYSHCAEERGSRSHIQTPLLSVSVVGSASQKTIFRSEKWARKPSKCRWARERGQPYHGE